jgi:tetratricopeptide (TPR) repeat protein
MIRRIPMTWWLATAGVLVGPLSSPCRAWADSPTTTDEAPKPAPPESAESAKTRAAQATREGLNLFQNKQYEAARYAFSRAFELDPQTDTLVELGLAELEAGHPFAAVEHLREYLDRKDAPAANADAVRTQWLPRAEDETALKEFFPEPVPLPASDGTHPAEPSAPVMSHSWIAPPVSYERGRTTRSPARWATAMGLESAALAAAGVAIGFSVAVERAASEANGLIQRVRSETGGDSGCLAPNPASACPQVRQDRDAERANAIRANWLFAGAGTLAALGAVSFFLWPSHPDGRVANVHVGPVLGDRSAGAAVVGTW